MEKQDEQVLQQAQMYGQQIQSIMAQKANLAVEFSEVKKSLEEIKKTNEKFVYRLSGNILIKEETEAVRKDLEEKENLISVRLKALERQEAKLKEKIEEFRTKLIKVKPQKEEE